MKRVLFLMLCLVTSMNIVLAQNRKITGTVVSAEDNEPVIGAAVVVRGTQIGIVTDVDGVFSLEVPASAKTLVISYLGMKTQEVAIKDGLKIILESDFTQSGRSGGDGNGVEPREEVVGVCNSGSKIG